MDNFFGNPYMMWHDGINPKSVCYLKGEERDRAEIMLIESMEDGSHYAAMGLRELKSQKAIPIMKELLKKVGSDLKIQIALALNTIEDTTEYVPDIIDVLQYNGSPYVRLKAAMVLRNYPTIEVIESLFTAIEKDPDYLVRYHASESLLHIHGFRPNISEYKEIFHLICVEFDSDHPDSYREAVKQYTKAADMLRDLFAK
ncbi:MAG: HEAT repeat domain-containing protein [Candidatus Thorarchaeota archaeon]|nr:HEAT repeat domain-containing protein [Candidatus Thorarchaeota archaeon]